MSLALKHRDRTLALQSASAPASGGGLTPSPARRASIDPAAGQIKLRLRHDAQRLKQIKATSAKILAKRDMLPEYRAWCDGLLEAGRMTVGNQLGATDAEDVLPTIMVWSIDVGDWARALELAEHVLRFHIELPTRFRRDAATLLVEEFAEAAMRDQALDKRFPLDLLYRVEELTAGIDMHDEVQAKLQKAIGVELVHAAGDAEADLARPTITDAITRLERAQSLHDRSGVKTHIRGLRKALAALPASDQDNAGTSG